MDYLLGIDVGSTSMKALLFDLDGNLVSSGSYPTESVAQDPKFPNWQVYYPEHIWDGISDAIKQAVSQINQNDRIIAAAVTGLGADAVPLNGKGSLSIHLLIGFALEQTLNMSVGWRMLDLIRRLVSLAGNLLSGVLCFAFNGFRKMNQNCIVRLNNG